MSLDESGKNCPIVMGSYGIGIERTMAAVVERFHDEAGISWPVSVAPLNDFLHNSVAPRRNHRQGKA